MSNTAAVGFDGLHDEHVPSLDATKFATVVTFAGNGASTVRVKFTDDVATGATVTDCVQLVPAGAGAAHDQPSPAPE